MLAREDIFIAFSGILEREYLAGTLVEPHLVDPIEHLAEIRPALIAGPDVDLHFMVRLGNRAVFCVEASLGENFLA
jgi:hypothetical protein